MRKTRENRKARKGYVEGEHRWGKVGLGHFHFHQFERLSLNPCTPLLSLYPSASSLRHIVQIRRMNITYTQHSLAWGFSEVGQSEFKPRLHYLRAVWPRKVT